MLKAPALLGLSGQMEMPMFRNLLIYLLKSIFGLPYYTYMAWTDRILGHKQKTLLTLTPVTWGILILLLIACFRHPPTVDGTPLYITVAIVFLFVGWLAHFAATEPPRSARS
ncbi:hypothetical protein HYW59_00315 [Candidatus Kaiserbacteria bacterium]|nr:hypothetical protein [Candidatus Kaiserbacteria bacterium]